MRMTVIYETKGKAREYCEHAVNLYRGCAHGCRYCYAPGATYQSPADFKNAHPRAFIIEKIEKEAAHYAGKEILLCFTCDPYQPIDDEHQLTRKAIIALHAAGARVTILTKGGRRSLRDLDLLGGGDKYGASLTFSTTYQSRRWEPEAADPRERQDCLKIAHRAGIFTWASLEPVIMPEQALEIIQETHEYIDLYKIGRWNYDARARRVDYRKFAQDAKALLESLGKSYLLKKDLAVFLEEGRP